MESFIFLYLFIHNLILVYFLMLYIIMGVSGCGKSTVGKLLADKLNLPFFDADDFHPKANIEKMSLGIPLSDSDRLPWLQQLADLLQDCQSSGAVLACSALKESYRQILNASTVNWVLLDGSMEQIYQRLQSRKGHFMKPDLLQSQFDTLEKPAYGLHLDVTSDPDKLVALILEKYHNHAI